MIAILSFPVRAEGDFCILINGKEVVFINDPYMENNTIMVPLHEINEKLNLNVNNDQTIKYISLRSFAEANQYIISWDNKSNTANLICNQKYFSNNLLDGRLYFNYPYAEKEIITDATPLMNVETRNSIRILPSKNGFTFFYADEFLCYSTGNLMEDAENLDCVVAATETYQYNDVEILEVLPVSSVKKYIEDVCSDFTWCPFGGERPQFDKIQYFQSYFKNYIVKLKDNSLILFSVLSDNQDVSIQNVLSSMKSGQKDLEWENEFITSCSKHAYEVYQRGQYYLHYEIVPKGTSEDYKYRMNVVTSKALPIVYFVGDEQSQNYENDWNLYRQAKYLHKKYFPDDTSNLYFNCGGYYANEEQMRVFIDLSEQLMTTVELPNKNQIECINEK